MPSLRGPNLISFPFQGALTLCDFRLDVLDGFSLLHLDRYGLARQGLDEELLGAST